MKNDYKKKTGLIIRKDGEYLVGTILYSTDLRWSWSPFDAWITRSREEARKVARKVGGEILLFNPVLRQMKEAE
ncbi:MAG: hypothetical protein J6U01_11935 [Clostridia bacterium]|nr:hypothetical protein [Clostridia bacterium]